MITFVVTANHRYTVEKLCSGAVPGGPPCRSMSYDDLFCARDIEPGAYIFCDHERLSHVELLAAAEIFALASRSPQVRLFNDPAKVRTRFGLLRMLREAGVNDFDAYAADGLPRPAKFPVFVREIATHGKPVTPLLSSQEALDAALAEAVRAGYPLSGLLVIEFCAEPVRDNVWRRWGAHRFGATTVLAEVVSEDNWNVKYGAAGLVDDEVYRADDEATRANRHVDVLDRVFALAGVEYGRADFGLVGGRPQIYEINTNPHIGALAAHPSAVRQATLEYNRSRFLAALAALDAPAQGDRVSIERETRSDPKHVIDELRAQLREPRDRFAALQGEIARLREEADRLRATAPVRAAPWVRLFGGRVR